MYTVRGCTYSCTYSAHTVVHTVYIRICSEFSFIHHNSFQKNDRLTCLVDYLNIHWYLYIVLVLGNCGV